MNEKIMYLIWLFIILIIMIIVLIIIPKYLNWIKMNKLEEEIRKREYYSGKIHFSKDKTRIQDTRK